MPAKKRERWLPGVFAVMLVIVCAIVFSLADIRMTERKGSDKKDGKLTVNAGHADLGYFMAKGPKGNNRMKLTVESGGTKLQYDINSDGEYEVFPLQLGKATYTITLWRQVDGKKYGKIGQIKITAKMKDELNCFLYPNQYVNYTEKTPCVLKAAELCEGMTDQAEIFRTIKAYILKNFKYDFAKSLKVANSTGVLPDIDYCWDNGKGICQDLSAMTCAMLRSQGVPARLIIGQLGSGTAHAWVLAVVNGEDVFFDPTAELNASSKSETYTMLRWY